MTVTQEPQADAPIGPSRLASRLRAARDRVDELEEALTDERARRNQLIVEAAEDEGMPYREIGHHAGLSKARVIAVLAAN